MRKLDDLEAVHMRITISPAAASRHRMVMGAIVELGEGEPLCEVLSQRDAKRCTKGKLEGEIQVAGKYVWCEMCLDRLPSVMAYTVVAISAVLMQSKANRASRIEIIVTQSIRNPGRLHRHLTTVL